MDGSHFSMRHDSRSTSSTSSTVPTTRLPSSAAVRGGTQWVGSLLALGAMIGLAALGVGTSRGAESSIPLEPQYSDLSEFARANDAGNFPSPDPATNAVASSVVLIPMTTLASTSKIRMYDGRPIRPVATMRMKVTAYSPDAKSCGASADGITASGYSVQTNGGALVAADPKVLPLGSLVSVPGYDGGVPVPVLDVGGAIKGRRLDVLFTTHEIARAWGVRTVDVVVWEYADGKPNGFKRLRRGV